jgi:isopentenyl diphosphate isomerase/L-lactate dehydrogenase-like FMN-dependent dehydrogenase
MASETTKSNGRTARPEKGGRHRAARVGWHGVHDPATGGKDEQWTLVPGSTAPSDIAVWRDRSTRPGFQSSASCAGRLKGILHPDDARRAVEHWVEGVIVSNHGGRQVDGAVASLEALPAVVSAVAGRAAVMFDGGIRRGADVFKALALGARAVLLGRPYCWGLAVDGEQGVRDVLLNLLADVELTLGLAGCAACADVSRDSLTEESDCAFHRAEKGAE